MPGPSAGFSTTTVNDCPAHPTLMYQCVPSLPGFIVYRCRCDSSTGPSVRMVGGAGVDPSSPGQLRVSFLVMVMQGADAQPINVSKIVMPIRECAGTGGNTA